MMTPSGLLFRSKRISGPATVATERRVLLQYSGGYAGVIGGAYRAGRHCRTTNALMRGIVAKDVARAPQGGGAVPGCSRALVTFSKAATSPLAKADCRAVQML